MTKLLYLEDWNQLNGSAKVIEVTTYQDKPFGGAQGKPAIVLDQTIFYPQGGGQPCDTGIINSTAGEFMITAVRCNDGIVYHMGQFTSGTISAGETVTMTVDKDRRALHSRLHSGGHLLDMAVLALKLNWIPGKGYHFPEGPYIEYAGNLDGLDKEKIKADMEAQCAKLIAANTATSIRFMPKEEMHEVCHHVPDYLPEGKPARVVMYGNFGVPCGGTHVNSLGEIGAVTIRKIRQDGANIRVAYDVTR